MPQPRLDQLLPTFSYGDAIGNHTLALRGFFRRGGAASEIFAHIRHHRLGKESREYGEYLGLDAPGNVCFFHFSIGSPLTDFFTRLRARRVLIYHNVTPPEYFHGVNRQIEFECRLGREQLEVLAGKVELALADSEFNRLELEQMGFAPTAVLPIIVDFAAHDAAGSGDLARRWRDGWTNILHVGRLVPNKRIEDLVKCFHFYKRINPRSRLLLVGTDTNLENYSGAVRALVERLGLTDVHFTGHVSFRELCAYYQVADLYLVMSEHEGFCVPLLEAMHFGVPVVAFRAAAIPHTLGTAGLQVVEKRFEEIAELMHLAVADETLRARLVQGQRARLEAFAPARIEERLRDVLRHRGLLPA